MASCKNIEVCGFVKKFANLEKGLAVKGYVTLYCNGDKQSACKRLEYKQTNGKAPPDEMLPSGGFITI